MAANVEINTNIGYLSFFLLPEQIMAANVEITGPHDVVKRFLHRIFRTSNISRPPDRLLKLWVTELIDLLFVEA
jgi:hypothetical protein